MDAISFGSKENKSDDDEDSEESGWTTYFDDFFANKKQDQYYNYSGGGRINYNDNNNLVCDAASFVDVDHKIFSKSSGRLIPSTSTLTKLSSKTVLDIKKRNKEIFYEDSLEDTASSPVNSPKIMQVERGIPDLRLDGQSVEKTTGMLLMEGQKISGMRKCLYSMPIKGDFL